MKWRRFGTAAVVALIFAEGDSASDSGDSASSGSELSGSDSGESADIGLSVTNTSQVSSSDSDVDSGNSSDSSGSNRGQRPPGQPGATQGLTIEELKDIPLKGDDGPIKR